MGKSCTGDETEEAAIEVNLGVRASVGSENRCGSVVAKFRVGDADVAF